MLGLCYKPDHDESVLHLYLNMIHIIYFVMFIDETLYDDAFFKKIFTGATPHQV